MMTSPFETFTQATLKVLLWPMFGFPLVTLIGGVLCAAWILRHQRISRRRLFRWRAFQRAFFKKSVFFGPSGRVDLAFLLFNATIFLWCFGWATGSSLPVSRFVHDTLTQAFGARPASTLSPLSLGCVATFALFVAYEFGYWLDHYISHKIPFLWHFHKVHHTADQLSFLTVHRVHPIDTLVFGYVLCLCFGVVQGGLDWTFGRPMLEMTLGGSNIFVFAATLCFVHLQHSGVWWMFPKALSKLLMSPAQHQMHHAQDQGLYGCNLGSCLCVFDWLFGTWRSPHEVTNSVEFGVPASDNPPQGIWGHIWQPFVDAAEPLTRRVLRGPFQPTKPDPAV